MTYTNAPKEFYYTVSKFKKKCRESWKLTISQGFPKILILILIFSLYTFTSFIQ